MTSKMISLPPIEKRAPDSTNDVMEDRLFKLGMELAQDHKLTALEGPSFLLLGRIDQQEDLLQTSYQRIAHSEDIRLAQSHAAEWLLDNFYLVEEAFQQIREDLPPNYYHKLPLLESAGIPPHVRVFNLAWSLLHQVGFDPDFDQITRFVNGYQQGSKLKIGEVWAIPIMLRIGILEMLAQVMSAISGIPYPSFELQLDQTATRPDRRALVGSCIQGLRSIRNMDWKKFFEAVNQVELILMMDPSGVYPHVDFDTRDQYRKAVEDLALASARAEDEIARLAVQLATRAQADHSSHNGPEAFIQAHVGYYLVERGVARLEEQIAYRPDWRVRIRRWLWKRAFPLYIGSILFMVVGLMAILYGVSVSFQVGLLQFIIAGVLALLPASVVATGLVNLLVTYMIPPRKPLARLDFSQGVPESCRTMVVIPALLNSPQSINSLLRQIELYFLGNEDKQVFFALLTDFQDAPQQHMPDDEQLLKQVTLGIQSLNERYRVSLGTKFFLFHRDRKWNPAENAWIGWERKRGKLMELNQYLRHADQGSFSDIEGDTSVLGSVRYVITMDEDTVLPNNTASTLIGIMAHPFNRPQFDSRTGKVVAGYTLLQPRVEVKPESSQRTWFTRIYARNGGVDLYSQVVSNVYQDLFAEGSYMGKGIYDVDAFMRSLEGQIPENAVLSHDLIEGLHGRAGMVSDIALYEGFPPFYLAYAQRIHRWVRGDWQLLPWLLPFKRFKPVGARKNPLSPLGIWKILDNLRQSLIYPGTMAFLVVSWLWFPGPVWLWTFIALFSLSIPSFMSLIPSIWVGIRSKSIGNIVQTVWTDFINWILNIVFLPYQTLLIVDAIGTTLVRLIITRKRLLQWTTASHTIRVLSREFMVQVTWKRMRMVVLFVLILLILVGYLQPGKLLQDIPVLFLWLISPQVAHWISQPATSQSGRVSTGQRQKLRMLARRTWLFFEQFVGPEDHWLPPDHFQEEPRGTVAHRTSPTNIGLGLLSTFSAYDLGYIGLSELSIRLQNTFNALHELERYSGHFLNWYETQHLYPLSPRYVSTVDSGNLAGSFLTLRQGCQEVRRLPVLRSQRWQGLVDTLDLLKETLLTARLKSQKEALFALIDHIRQAICIAQDNPECWLETLKSIALRQSVDLDEQIMKLVEESVYDLDPETLRDLRIWTERLRQQLRSITRTVESLLPWLEAFDEIPPRLKSIVEDIELQESWQSLLAVFQDLPSLQALETVCEVGLEKIREFQRKVSKDHSHDPDGEVTDWCRKFSENLAATRQKAEQLLDRFDDLGKQAEIFFQEMDFSFLFNEQRNLFRIGYNVDTGRLDENHYDLLASEARLASLIAIAKGDAPQKHWLYLNRPLTKTNQGNVLISWSGSMFEYLMPNLLVKQYPNTLLDLVCTNVVQKQIEYGNSRGVPWGISESGFFHFDANMNYQYRAFGVPGLGLKRGLEVDLVITPYATVLALSVTSKEVIKNLLRLNKFNMLGLYGFYEALDFTESRLPMAQNYAPVLSYMAHHQGMILLALTNFVENHSMIRRFHADPRIEAYELLLQEQIPANPRLQIIEEQEIKRLQRSPSRLPVESWTPKRSLGFPSVHFLSNGRFGSLITQNGGGFSQYLPAKARRSDPLMVTRWRPDKTLDQWGTWIYVQDVQTGDYWSAGIQPVGIIPEVQYVEYYPHQVEFSRRDHEISTQMKITISPTEDVEVRKISLVNHQKDPRRLKVTSYAEVVFSDQNTDARHPAFNKLFIEVEHCPEIDGLLLKRRPRFAGEEPFYVVHMLVSENSSHPELKYESDRSHFIGRGKTLESPGFLDSPSNSLKNTSGTTLDPIMALSFEVDLASRQTKEVAFVTLIASSKRQALSLARQFRSWPRIERTFNNAHVANNQELDKFELTIDDLSVMQQLLSVLFFSHPALRIEPEKLASNQRGQSGLWAFAISGDYPLLLVRIDQADDALLVKDLLKAHSYWRRRGLKIDLVILNRSPISYNQDLQGQLFNLITQMGGDRWLNQRGGIYLLRSAQMTEKDVLLLETVASAVLDGSKNSLAEQVHAMVGTQSRLPRFAPMAEPLPSDSLTPPLERPTDLQFDNGYGGFSPDGKEYVIYLGPGQWTPAPWINVIANPDFGFMVSEAGMGCTWAGNSSENRLTPWRNDPLSDLPAEAIYLRNEDTGQFWTPTPLPIRTRLPYRIRHGAGYSVFEHNSHGLEQKMRVFAAPDSPVKIVNLSLKNTLHHIQRYTVTYYAEWVLGPDRERMAPFVIPEFDPGEHALLARNDYNQEFKDRVAFLAASREIHGFTTDRTEFLGQNGSYTHPDGLTRVGLSRSVNPGRDPCAALQVLLWLDPGETKEVTFLLGQGRNLQESLQMINEFRRNEVYEQSWHDLRKKWMNLLSAVSVKTPDPAMDLMLNQWLLYQSISCRLWGRSALYQSGGAFGFRDQLQDVLALSHTAPELTREHILRSARHQFEEGDVLHWWHPPSSRGIRTRCSDNLLWLPYVTAQYIKVTGDVSILQEKIPFLTGQPLQTGEHERYGLYEITEVEGSLLEHCQRALAHGTTTGSHGLPLMGSHDWNDGMNRVGWKGKGESVWLGWFLYATLQEFKALCEEIGEPEQALQYHHQAEKLRQSLEENAWDGAWYRRAYFDDGAPLGSSQNLECKIDSIAQSWAVLSEGADPERARQAMQSVHDLLVNWDESLVLLFTPPFNQTPLDPGYIKGYPPGVRENGGQYTHAALWAVRAFATLGDGDLAGNLYKLLNPVYHSDKIQKADRYRVEPYVVAADIYSVAPHTGRGGWTWYTGSASWMYQVGLEAILGIKRLGDRLQIDPCIPANWPEFGIKYRFGEARYHIHVVNPGQVNRGVVDIDLDGQKLAGNSVPLVDDNQVHQVKVRLG
jgi:cyclic beta-1,2-glucan synthetase